MRKVWKVGEAVQAKILLESGGMFGLGTDIPSGTKGRVDAVHLLRDTVDVTFFLNGCEYRRYGVNPDDDIEKRR